MTRGATRRVAPRISRSARRLSGAPDPFSGHVRSGTGTAPEGTVPRCQAVNGDAPGRRMGTVPKGTVPASHPPLPPRPTAGHHGTPPATPRDGTARGLSPLGKSPLLTRRTTPRGQAPLLTRQAATGNTAGRDSTGTVPPGEVPASHPTHHATGPGPAPHAAGSHRQHRGTGQHGDCPPGDSPRFSPTSPATPRPGHHGTPPATPRDGTARGLSPWGQSPLLAARERCGPPGARKRSVG